MENEDSRNALFCDPNAYIQNFKNNKKQTEKVVFQQPYEHMSNFYIDNEFSKHNWGNINNTENLLNKCEKNGCW